MSGVLRRRTQRAFDHLVTGPKVFGNLSARELLSSLPTKRKCAEMPKIDDCPNFISSALVTIAIAALALPIAAVGLMKALLSER